MASSNQRPATEKQGNHYQAQVSRQECKKHHNTQYIYNNI